MVRVAMNAATFSAPVSVLYRSITDSAVCITVSPVGRDLRGERYCDLAGVCLRR